MAKIGFRFSPDRIVRNVRAVTSSVRSDQKRTTSLERSSRVIAPSCCAFAILSASCRARLTSSSSRSGTTMSSMPIEIPDRVANRKPTSLRRSSIATVFSRPSCR